MFDLKLVEKFYNNIDSKIKYIRDKISKPLTLSEKILYLHSALKVKDFKRGMDYVEFNPDRVAMQDATAQMALLQFMMANKEQVAVPSTVHADHLIQAKSNSVDDLTTALDINSEVYDFLS